MVDATDSAVEWKGNCSPVSGMFPGRVVTGSFDELLAIDVSSERHVAIIRTSE